MSRFEHDFTAIASDCNLPTIASLHLFHDHMFVYKSLHNYVSLQGTRLEIKMGFYSGPSVVALLPSRGQKWLPQWPHCGM